MATTRADLLLSLIHEVDGFEGRIAALTVTMKRHIAHTRAFVDDLDPSAPRHRSIDDKDHAITSKM